MDLIIRNATVVNEGTLEKRAVGVSNGRFCDAEKVAADAREIDGTGCLLLPGVIDTHVHFRDPGLTEKADFATESRAAAAGGVTSVVDMPNTNPQTTTLELLEEKERMAAEKSLVNYGFMLGATNSNIADLLEIDPERFAAIKLFLGSSTGNMLVNDPRMLDLLFKKSRQLIVAHCEDEGIIRANNDNFRLEFRGTDRETAELHPKIRNTEACYVSSYKAIERARKYGTQFHLAHVSTATELNLLSNKALGEKNITAEVTPNHLWFDDRDYAELGNKIKCNPAIKTNDDRLALWAGLYDGLIDTIGTDHAPHTLQQKEQPYFDAPGGIPSIQHALVMMLEAVVHNGLQGDEENDMERTWLPLLVEKMSHNPAKRFGIKERGFVKNGYWADFVLVRTGVENTVKEEDLLYKCGWSPLTGSTFHSQVEKTFVNGNCVYDREKGIEDTILGMPLEYSK